MSRGGTATGQAQGTENSFERDAFAHCQHVDATRSESASCSTNWLRLSNCHDNGLYRVKPAVRQGVDDDQDVLVGIVVLCLPSQIPFGGRKLSTAKILPHVRPR
jgi:hypothetical protein